MSSVVAASMHAICMRVKIVPRKKSGTKSFAWTDSHDSSIILLSLDSSTVYVEIMFFCEPFWRDAKLNMSVKLNTNIIIDICQNIS